MENEDDGTGKKKKRLSEVSQVVRSVFPPPPLLYLFRKWDLVVTWSDCIPVSLSYARESQYFSTRFVLACWCNYYKSLNSNPSC